MTNATVARAKKRLRITALATLLACLAGGGLLFVGLRGLLAAQRQRSWQEVTARIVDVQSGNTTTTPTDRAPATAKGSKTCRRTFCVSSGCVCAS